MQTSLFIPIHSFVDLITNSSSELFICADKNTILGIQKIVNSLLKVAGSALTFDDLFVAELVEGETYSDYPVAGVVVTAKNPDLAETAKILSGLTDLFEINSEYNG